MKPRLSRCAFCGKEIWGFVGDWIHEDTGLGSAPTDEWCHASPDHLHHEKRLKSYSVQWRCPQMDRHYRDPGRLPVPCDQCYSLIVTSEKIPWRPTVRWQDQEITP